MGHAAGDETQSVVKGNFAVHGVIILLAGVDQRQYDVNLTFLLCLVILEGRLLVIRRK